MLNGKSVLIVEENSFLALDLSQAIEEAEGQVVGPTDQVSQALELLASGDVRAAIVDCRLVGQSVALTSQLAERRIPFVIYAETYVPVILATLHPDVPVLRKPVHPRMVIDRLLAEMGRIER